MKYEYDIVQLNGILREREREKNKRNYIQIAH